jgi:O-antigen/teichoic acid export membrane protein
MPEARKPTLLGQALVAFCGNSSGYLVAILTGIVVARVLGPSGKGIVAYAALVMAVFTTTGAGLQNGVLRQCGPNGKPQQPVYGAALRLMGIMLVPITLGLVAVAMLDPRYGSFWFVAAAVPFGLFIQIANGVLLLNNDVRSTVIGGAIPTVGAGVATIPALLVFHGGLIAVLAIWTASFAASALYALIRINTYLAAFSARTSSEYVREQAVFGWKSGSSSVAAFLNLRIDIFVVSVMLDVRTLGIYTLAVATGELMWQLSRPVTLTAMGRIAVLEPAAATELAAKVTRHVLALEAAVGVAIFVLAPPAVRFVYGPVFAQSADVVRWLLPGLVLYATASTLTYYVSVKAGRPAIMLAIQLGSMLICAAVSILTIGSLGIFGAALATTVTYCTAAVIVCVLFARLAGISPARFLLLQRSDFERLRRMWERAVPHAPRVRGELRGES